MLQIAVHGSGLGYVYVDSGPGRLALGRCLDDQDRWQGIRYSAGPVREDASAWLRTVGQSFDMAYAEGPGYEDVQIWFPHWVLCLLCALWPAHCLYAAVRRRLIPFPRTAWAC